MVAFLFLSAPMVVLIAVLIMQRFQPSPDRDPGIILMARVAEGGRVEPRFSAVNDNGEHEDPGTLMDQHSILTG
jgi:hypothetical protein